MASSGDRRFIRARIDPTGQDGGGEHEIRSLIDLINFNATNNPEHIFCFQAFAKPANDSGNEEDDKYNSQSITFKALKDAVNSCSSWIRDNLISSDQAGMSKLKPAPVALYMESDLGLFIHMVALLALGTPVLLLSARLSAESVRHLLVETRSQSILLSKRTERLIATDVADLAGIKVSLPFSFFSTNTTGSTLNGWSTSIQSNEDGIGDLILHSSGTTGLPKPIRLAHQYLLGYAACHSFPTTVDISWPNLSTLPLYHGFGMLAPCLSLSVGMPCVLPPHNIIPAAHSTLELLSTFGAQSLMTVPSILDEMLILRDHQRQKALMQLRKLRLVAVGGGPLSDGVRDVLIAEGVKILNHYGATEIGAIAPIFQPGDDYDPRYLRLRTDLGLDLLPVAQSCEQPQRFKLVGYPAGWGGKAFEIQDELIKRLDSNHIEVQILGRRDDLIVLKNGEKVIPRYLEEALIRDQSIKTAVCLGQGRLELAVLIEPSNENENENMEIFVEGVWQLLSEQINPSLDAHAQISSKQAIIVKSPNKAIPRSDKGSVMRREVGLVFQEEIQAAYEALESQVDISATKIDFDNLQASIQDIVERIMRGKLNGGWHLNDDLFELGMDSLQATRLARVFSSSVNQAAQECFDTIPKLTASFVYKNPSIDKLTSAIDALRNGQSARSWHNTELRASEMRKLADEYLQVLNSSEGFQTAGSSWKKSTGAVILLTGSTGNLGAHMLSCLAQDSRVSRIICLNRCISASDSGGSLRDRQEQANAMAGVPLSKEAWHKVSFMTSNTQAPNFGLSHSQIAQLGATMTDIIHLAWPMDFNRQLDSFRPHLDALITLIRLARSVRKARPREEPPRFLLSSSISVVRHYSERTGSFKVPEAQLLDPLVTAEMGYAEAKWVSEFILQNAKEWCTPMIVRIGQLSGPEYSQGQWKPEEHVPALFKASQLLSAFPDIKGEFSWLPVDRAARSLIDILFYGDAKRLVYYHVENPVRQPWSILAAFAGSELRIKGGCIPFTAWLERLAATGHAASLVSFFKNDFEALACGDIVLDTSVARGASVHLRGSGGLTRDLIIEYVRRWRKLGYVT